MSNDKTRTVLLITLISLSLVTFSLFVFYQHLPLRKKNFAAPEGAGMGTWFPGQVEAEENASDQKENGEHERGTTFYTKNEEPDPVSKTGCNCRWMFNVYRDPSYKQKKNEIGWLKGHSNGLSVWYTKHINDIQTDRSVLNLIDLASPEEKSLTSTYRGETVLEIKHIQGCNRCFGEGKISFYGVQTQADYQKYVKPKDGFDLDEHQIDVRSETVLNQRDEESWVQSESVRDHARLRVQSKITHRMDRRDEYTIKEYGHNEHRWPQIVARCNCDHPSCSNPVDAFMRTNDDWMSQQIQKIINAKERVSGSLNRERTREWFLQLSSEETRDLVWDALWDVDWE